MATPQSFNDMLNEHLTYRLLEEEYIKRDYLLQKVEKDEGWKGGTIPVPFKGSDASTVTFGGLAADTDISEDDWVRGELTTPREVWGTMVFHDRDLGEHDGKVPEDSFLSNLLSTVDSFVDRMKQAVSVNLLTGAYFASITTADVGSVGSIVVDHPERFTLKQKVIVDDDNSAVSADGYVQSINMETSTITIDTTRAGGADLDLAAYTVAQNAKVYHDGAATNSFTSLRAQLLSATNNGDATLFGQTKLSYPYLQAVQVSGATISATNILDKLFDAWTSVRQIGKGNPTEILLSFKHFGSVLKAIEDYKGAYHTDGAKPQLYGWTEITITGVKGTLKIVAIQEMPDDIIFIMDWRGVKFHTNRYFKKRIAPDGKQYYEVRATTGYKYIVDICLYGEMAVSRPSHSGVIHSISY